LPARQNSYLGYHRAAITQREHNMEHPFIDFQGDGYGDPYDTAHVEGGQNEYYHQGQHHVIDAVAIDYDRDGYIDKMHTDSNDDGTLDTLQEDTDGDGYMDDSEKYYHGEPVHLNHPYIDFDGDGHGDHYSTYGTADGSQVFNHTDHSGHVDAMAIDYDNDGLIDKMVVDSDGDGDLDKILVDTNGDGIMDSSEPL
jgi:hypothetical protein